MNSNIQEYNGFITACLFMLVIMFPLIGIILGRLSDIKKRKREEKRINDIINK